MSSKFSKRVQTLLEVMLLLSLLLASASIVEARSFSKTPPSPKSCWGWEYTHWVTDPCGSCTINNKNGWHMGYFKRYCEYCYCSPPCCSNWEKYHEECWECE